MSGRVDLSRQPVFDCCLSLLADGLERARAASLYVSPGDAYFSSVALALDLFNGLLAPDGVCLSAAFELVEANGQVVCQWSIDAGSAAPDERLVLSHGEWCVGDSALARRFHYALRVSPAQSLGSAEPMAVAIGEQVARGWVELAESAAEDFCLKAGKSAPVFRDIEPDYPVQRYLQRIYHSRLRDLMQRLEEELPSEFRVAKDARGHRIPSQLYFMRTLSVPGKGGEQSGRQVGQRNVLAFEDLNVIDRWCGEGLGALLERLERAVAELYETTPASERHWLESAADSFLSWFNESNQANWCEYLLDTFESRLHGSDFVDRIAPYPERVCLAQARPVLRLDHRSDALSYSGRQDLSDFKIAIIETALNLAQGFGHHQADHRTVVFWPISILGRAMLVVHLRSAALTDEAGDRSRGLSRLRRKVAAFHHLNDAAWNLYFDLFCDLFTEGLSQLYLEIAQHRRQSGSSEIEPLSVSRLVNRLNSVAAFLFRELNICPAYWSSVDARGVERAVSLWELASRVADSEVIAPSENPLLSEEFQQQKLAREMPWLSALWLRPAFEYESAQPELQFMFEHLVMRLGQFVQYRLPSLLMALEPHAHWRVEREKKVYRHELGSLVSVAREVSLNLQDRLASKGIEAQELSDIRYALRLAWGVMGSIDEGGERWLTAHPANPLDLAPFFARTQRLLPQKWACRFSDSELEADIRIVTSNAPKHLALVSEKDLYAIWKNLWNNARKVLEDFTLDHAVEGPRYRKQQDILGRFGAFSKRHAPGVKPRPELRLLLYPLHEGGRDWLAMDILDNAPELAASRLSYPDRIEPGHYGLYMVNSIVESLTNDGIPTRFRPVTGLTEQHACNYHDLGLAHCGWAETARWSITSVYFTPAEDFT